MSDRAVSVVIPTHNHGHFIKETIQCVLGQTFQDFEIIIVDNGSVDNTREIVSSIEDERIFYHWQEDSGLPANSRNVGVKLAKTGLIAFLDSDDRWYPEKLKKVMEVFESHPNVYLVCHNEYVIKDGKKIGKSDYGPYVDDMYEKLLFEGNCLSTSAVVVKKEKLIEAGMFTERKDFLSVEDYDLWLKLAVKKNKFFFLEDILGEYILHESNVSSNIEMHYNNLFAVRDVHYGELARKESLKVVKALKRRARSRVGLIRDLLKSGNFYKAGLYLFKLPYEMFKSYRIYKKFIT
ncbi:MAG: glycosyltransferase [Actinomycetia bacterium]|nr:glycosyltransferase [Actinomycetes bacterium]